MNAAPALLRLAGVLAICGALGARGARGAGAADLGSAEARILWQPDLRLRGAESLFASPHDADRVLAVTRQGLFQTLDDAQTWEPVPNTSRDVLGRVSDVFFSPLDTQRVFLASLDKGVFRSDDGGKTWRAAGDAASGMVSSHVLRIAGPPGDRALRTFYATHGAEGAGLSKTMDGGKTWYAVSRKYRAEELLMGDGEILMAGGLRDEEDVWGIFRSMDGGEFWSELQRDVRPTQGTNGCVHTDRQWFGTLGGRILAAPRWEAVGPEEGGKWRSLFCAFGRAAGDEIQFAYDPYRHGLLASRDGFKTWWKENDGLFVDRLVKEGASVSANANGTTFYAPINGQLYVGRLKAGQGPYLARLKASPGVVRLPYHGYQKCMGELRAKLRELSAARNAGQLALSVRDQARELARWTGGAAVTFTARVTPTARERAVTSVTVDLSPLQGPGEAALFDDGRHGDGAAGDGLYGLAYSLSPRCLVRREWRDRDTSPQLPGPVPLTVTAKDASGAASSAVMVFSAYPRTESLSYWNGESDRWGAAIVHRGEGTVNEVEIGARSAPRCLRFTASPGPWLLGWGVDRRGDRNLTDQDTLIFWIRSTGPTGDVQAFLQDTRGSEDLPHFSNGVWLVKEGFLKALTVEWQRVRIPLDRLRMRTSFADDRCGGIAFGGDGAAGHDFLVDDIVVETEERP